jgi:hypothetical protein
MVLPVKIRSDGNILVAHTLDISAAGARLAVREQLQVGETVTLSRGFNKSQFRIAWVEQRDSREFHAGLEAIQPLDKFWGVDLACEAENREEPVFMKFLKTLPSK